MHFHAVESRQGKLRKFCGRYIHSAVNNLQNYTFYAVLNYNLLFVYV